MRQTKLNLYQGKKGGRRPGSGRKRIKSKGVSHRSRETISARTPMHINFKYKTYIKNKDCLRLLKRAILNARSHGLRVLHFSLQTNHIHLIVEADHNDILTTGMRSLTVTFAKGLKKGRVQIERFHLHVLKALRETRNAIHYVIFNQQKHEKKKFSNIDEYSSVLSLPNALRIIKRFSQAAAMILKIKHIVIWNLDRGKSYLARTAETDLVG